MGGVDVGAIAGKVNEIIGETTAKGERMSGGILTKLPSGKGKKYGTKAIENNKLEVFRNRFPKSDYVIEFSCPEYTSLCPRSGFPDFATIYITYAPKEWCVELKSLKLYMNGFRSRNVFHEDVTNVILDDLVKILEPKWMRVVGDFTVRGNIHTVIEARHGFPDSVYCLTFKQDTGWKAVIRTDFGK